MKRRYFRWAAWATIASIAAVCGWVAVGLARPLDPIPRFGEDHQTFAITNVSVVDVAKGTLLAGQTVLIDKGRIAGIGATHEVAVPVGTRKVDAAGKFLIPGLWDSHVHTLAHSTRLHFPLLLANGVTSIRNLGDGCSWTSNTDCAPDRVDWNAQEAEAQRLVPNITGTASFHFEDVDSVSDAARLVGALQKRGDTIIKLQLPDDVDPAVMKAIIREATRLGLPVAAHVPASVDLRDDAFKGLTSIEHGDQLLRECERQAKKQKGVAVVRACTGLLRTLAERGTAFVPTFVASTGQDVRLGSSRAAEDALGDYAPAPVAAIWTIYRYIHLSGMDASSRREADESHRKAMQIALLAHRSGVPVLVGTDSLDPFVLHGVSTHDELETLVQAGFSNAEALRAATVIPADFHESPRIRGQVIAGAPADLVLLDGNPLARIGRTRTIHSVFKGGIYFNKSELERMTAFAKAQASSHALNARLWWSLVGG